MRSELCKVLGVFSWLFARTAAHPEEKALMLFLKFNNSVKRLLRFRHRACYGSLWRLRGLNIH